MVTRAKHITVGCNNFGVKQKRILIPRQKLERVIQKHCIFNTPNIFKNGKGSTNVYTSTNANFQNNF